MLQFVKTKSQSSFSWWSKIMQRCAEVVQGQQFSPNIWNQQKHMRPSKHSHLRVAKNCMKERKSLQLCCERHLQSLKSTWVICQLTMVEGTPAQRAKWSSPDFNKQKSLTEDHSTSELQENRRWLQSDAGALSANRLVPLVLWILICVFSRAVALTHVPPVSWTSLVSPKLPRDLSSPSFPSTTSLRVESTFLELPLYWSFLDLVSVTTLAEGAAERREGNKPNICQDQTSD